MNNVKKAMKKLGAKAKDFFMSLKEKKAKLTAQLTVSLMSALALAAPAFADDDVDPDAAFNNVVGFFATWLGRIGLVVAFIGGGMFALAIKNEDAEAKTRGLMTMIAGLVLFALTKSLDLFGLTGGTL